MRFSTYADQLLEHRPRSSAGMVLLHSIDSTQTLARRIIDDHLKEGDRVPEIELVAWSQGLGHGRRGRAWSSPAGQGIYMTLIRSRQIRGWLQLLPLRVATALCQAIIRHTGVQCRLKWPNDLIVGDRKLGGILIEAVTLGTEDAVALIGCGINHGSDPSAFHESVATSVRAEAPAAPPLDELALLLIASVDEDLAHERSATEVVEGYQALALHEVGDSLRCEIGGELVVGRFQGFDEHGFLRLQAGGEERLISTGEILSGGR